MPNLNARSGAKQLSETSLLNRVWYSTCARDSFVKVFGPSDRAFCILFVTPRRRANIRWRKTKALSCWGCVEIQGSRKHTEQVIYCQNVVYEYHVSMTLSRKVSEDLRKVPNKCWEVPKKYPKSVFTQQKSHTLEPPVNVGCWVDVGSIKSFFRACGEGSNFPQHHIPV